MALNYSGGTYKIYTQSANDKLSEKPYYSSMVTSNSLEKVRYFSGTDVDLYFGNFYVGAATGIEYALSQSTMAIFGYNSYIFDDIAQGSRLVQGKIAINFVKSNYLYDILNTLAEIENISPISISKHSPMWNKSVDIYISYGNAKQDSPLKGSQLVKISNAYLTSSQQSIAPDGRTIIEIYDFIAQDIDLNASQMSSPVTVNDLLQEEDQTQNTNKDLEVSSASLSPDLSSISIVFSENIKVIKLMIKTTNNNIYYSTDFTTVADNEIKVPLHQDIVNALKEIPEYIDKHVQILITYQDFQAEDYKDISLDCVIKK